MSDPEPIATIFAPNNAALQKAFNDLDLTAEKLLTDKALLTKILTHHVVPSKTIKSSNLEEGTTTLETLQGGTLHVEVEVLYGSWKEIEVYGKQGSEGHVIMANIPCNELILHIIDSVLLP